MQSIRGGTEAPLLGIPTNDKKNVPPLRPVGEGGVFQ